MMTFELRELSTGNVVETSTRMRDIIDKLANKGPAHVEQFALFLLYDGGETELARKQSLINAVQLHERWMERFANRARI